METKRKSCIALTLLAVFAAAVLFVTYGTVLPAAPFAHVQLNGPSSVDSDGEFTGVVDTESHRALVLNADGDLTGVVSCTTADSPVDAITDVCVKDGLVYVAGVRFKPDSEIIDKERVAVYDKGGNFQDVVYEQPGNGSELPAIKSLSDAPDGVVVAYGADSVDDKASTIRFDLVNLDGSSEIHSAETGAMSHYGAAFATDENGDYLYATLSVRGVLGDLESNYNSPLLAGHVFTSIDISENGTLYACDDETGALCAFSPGTLEVNTLVDGEGFYNVHENGGVISLCNSDTGKVTLCDASGTIKSEFAEVKPSIGFSARMVLVWACGLYLVGLALVLGIRKLYRQIKSGNTRGIGAMLAAVAVVAAIAVAVGSLSYASYQKMLGIRANEINMCADTLDASAADLSAAMEKANDRNAIRTSDDELVENAKNLLEATNPMFTLVESAKKNNIGMYCSLYGKDDKGVFYLIGSSPEYVMGSTARGAEEKGLDAVFAGDGARGGELLRGKTLRDATQYRLVAIPTVDGKGVAGVVEVGSKMRTFESSITGDLAQRILALLILVLVVYLAYSELRACGECLFLFRQRQRDDGERAVAVLTRPFTLAITLLTSIDSVMTVLIARDLLTQAGMGDSTPLLGVPAVMLGVGMILGQGIYAYAGSRVGLRKLMALGALAMLACAGLTAAAVASGIFWLYCMAKLAMSVPFGMLYSAGYALPRIASDDETRILAAGGVKRTDTSAAALGTVIGGYAAHALGDVWVYALVGVACLPVILMALNLLPRGMQPLEKLAQPESKHGLVRHFARTPIALGIALFVILPTTLAAGYASFLFPLFSIDLGLSKAAVNNIVVLGQLVVFVCIDGIDRMEDRHGKWKVAMLAVALLGVVFLLFAINTTLVWSVAVIALVGLLCKSSDGWKAMWLKAAGEADVATGRAASAMFAARSMALIAQPFILAALLGATDSVAVIVIGLICVVCAGLFFLVTRHTSLAK